MTYDFDTVIDRRGTNSLKWDVGENELPMWVADMDFKTAPEIQQALIDRANHGVFGYSIIPDKWNEAYIGWWEKRHGFTIDKRWLVFSTGVIPSISSVVRKLTTPAEKVVIQTPVYNMFYNCVLNNGRKILESPLVYDGTRYEIDFDDLEEKLSDPQTSLMILCNPHNPVGRIWSRAELERIGELCMQYNVLVLSDEIHCDLTYPGCEYIPFASVSDACRNNSITCIAPTKAFNLAGLQTSAVVVPNPAIRHKVWRGLNTDEVAEPNAFAIDATIAAFTKGEQWLDELRQYIYENKSLVEEFLKSNIPNINVVYTEATYLLWLDCRNVTDNSNKFADFIREDTGLFLTSGSHYGKAGEGFLRLNIACPKSQVADGLNRLKVAVENYNG
jgi:cystathionine beta-lyase